MNFKQESITQSQGNEIHLLAPATDLDVLKTCDQEAPASDEC